MDGWILWEICWFSLTLRKTLDILLLTNQQLLTVFKEVKAVINSRPLVYVNDEINSYITRSPPHHLIFYIPKTGTQYLGEIDKEEFRPYVSSLERLLEILKKSKKKII